MAYLIIDAGNTRVKVFVFEEDKVVYDAALGIGSFEKEILKIFNLFSVLKVILSSVGAFQSEMMKVLSEKAPVSVLSNRSKVPFTNKYKTPTTLGVDRIALMSEAAVRFPKKNVLVVDAGTCVTFDFLTTENEYLGGAISLGMEMRYKALHHFTEKLPNLEFNAPESLIGDATNSSIDSGVVNGLVAEVDGIIDRYKEQYSDLTVVLTGGDMIYLSKRLKNSIFADANFLVEGLHSILKYEIQK